MKHTAWIPIIVLSFLFSTQAQQKNVTTLQKENSGAQKTTKVETAASTDIPYADTPFSLAVDKLPSNYRGHDIAVIYSKIEKALPPKDEFETTEQYNKRLKSYTVENLFAFNIELSEIVDFTYDADAQMMTAKIKTRPVPINDRTRPPFITGITTKMDKELVGSYTGQNSYGATTRVRKSIGQDFGIAIDQIPNSMTDKQLTIMSFSLNISFPVALSVAKDVKAKLGVLFICKLKAPYRIDSAAEVIQPTYSNPIDSLRLHKTLYTELKEIWFYNTESGEIVKKLR